jgi:glycosyltransferase involved in cell wall biosynthesis
MVASLEWSKDHPALFRGFAALLGRGVNARLRIVGDGARRRELEMLVKMLGITDRVEWRGAVDDVPRELATLDVFAFAVTEGEGLGIALVEALAAGLPVVASDVGACREVLAGGRWGRLVPGTDPDAWAEALIGATDATVPQPDELSRYDMKETYRAYARLLGDPL